ncbi:MAG: hypothetical protein R6U35_06260 [Candidatus Humimicrobiaceae bacterium]
MIFLTAACIINKGRITYDGEASRTLTDEKFLKENHLDLPLKLQGI